MKILFYVTISIVLTLPSFSAFSCTIVSNVPRSTPDIRFKDNGDSTISDLQTSLMWAKCPEGLQSGEICAADGSTIVFGWGAALNAAEASTLAGHSNWRVPNIKELASLIETACDSAPTINLGFFPGTPGSRFWSSSPDTQNTGLVWAVHFNSAQAVQAFRTSAGVLVRLVRDEN